MKLYTEPRPAPKDIIKRHVPKDPSAQPKIHEEKVFDGPTLEDWINMGYDADRYPGADAFMRKRLVAQPHGAAHVDAKAITGENDPVEPAHAINGEHVTVE